MMIALAFALGIVTGIFLAFALMYISAKKAIVQYGDHLATLRPSDAALLLDYIEAQQSHTWGASYNAATK